MKNAINERDIPARHVLELVDATRNLLGHRQADGSLAPGDVALVTAMLARLEVKLLAALT